MDIADTTVDAQDVVRIVQQMWDPAAATAAVLVIDVRDGSSSEPRIKCSVPFALPTLVSRRLQKGGRVPPGTSARSCITSALGIALYAAFDASADAFDEVHPGDETKGLSFLVLDDDGEDAQSGASSRAYLAMRYLRSIMSGPGRILYCTRGFHEILAAHREDLEPYIVQGEDPWELLDYIELLMCRGMGADPSRKLLAALRDPASILPVQQSISSMLGKDPSQDRSAKFMSVGTGDSAMSAHKLCLYVKEKLEEYLELEDYARACGVPMKSRPPTGRESMPVLGQQSREALTVPGEAASSAEAASPDAVASPSQSHPSTSSQPSTMASPQDNVFMFRVGSQPSLTSNSTRAGSPFHAVTPPAKSPLSPLSEVRRQDGKPPTPTLEVNLNFRGRARSDDFWTRYVSPVEEPPQRDWMKQLAADNSRVVSEIYKGKLYVGPDISDPDIWTRVEQLHVDYVVNVAKELEDSGGGALARASVQAAEQLPNDAARVSVGMWDNVEERNVQASIDEVVRLIGDAIARGKCVYVHCLAGRSRSTTCVTAYVMQRERWSFRRAYNYVHKCRTCTEPNVGFLMELLKYEDRIGTTGGGANERWQIGEANKEMREASHA